MKAPETILRELHQREAYGRDLYGLADDICAVFGLSVREMCSPMQDRARSWARAAFYAMLHDSGAWTPQRIADLFGKDRTTVRAAILEHEARLDGGELPRGLLRVLSKCRDSSPPPPPPPPDAA